MNNTLLSYPAVTKFISSMVDYKNTFLYDRLDTPNYGFWPHLEYFLSHLQRFGNSESITERLSLIVPTSMEKRRAWGQWRIFRSAQSEITAIYIIENYFKGLVEEIIPTQNRPTSDIKIALSSEHHLVEIKAQSGQQEGSIHPREDGSNHFSPDNEFDLKSWLFEEKLSSRDGMSYPHFGLKNDRLPDILVGDLTMQPLQAIYRSLLAETETLEPTEVAILDDIFKRVCQLAEHRNRILHSAWFIDFKNTDDLRNGLLLSYKPGRTKKGAKECPSKVPMHEIRNITKEARVVDDLIHEVNMCVYTGTKIGRRFKMDGQGRATATGTLDDYFSKKKK